MQTTPAAQAIADFIFAKLPQSAARPIILGICGAQGSGKSTACAQLISILDARGRRAATLQLDDLYLSCQDRLSLAASVHPLLKTRGVPGTHDVQLGIDVLQAVRAGRPITVPRFDKARDDRTPRDNWSEIPADLDVLLFEGWCVGARPQSSADLIEPINDLERAHDADGRWRTYVNDRLASDYQQLFSYLDALVLLAAPTFDVVAGWRKQQEHALREQLSVRGLDASSAMSDEQIDRFVHHYERITRHVLNEMPLRADMTVRLNRDRQIKE
jgi:D-glycerate 3-kinase